MDIRIRDGYKLDVQKPKTMNLFESTRTLIDKKEWRKCNKT